MVKNENSRFSDYLAIFGSLAYVIMMVGLITLIPLLLLFFYPEEAYQLPCFALPGVLAIFSGYLIKLFTPRHSIKNLERHQGSVIVLLIWFVSILIGAIPFVMSGNYTFTQAIFETTSGFTTTGFTVTDVENSTHMILLYRSILHLFGGVGLVLILSSILSNVYGMQLFSAEGHTDRLTPSLIHSARTIMYIYLGSIISGTILYVSFHMSLFDAINHAISAVATGGFSTKENSIGYWCAERVGLSNSIGIDITTIILMLVGSTNFMATLALLRGKGRDFITHSETKVTIFLLSLATPLITVVLLTSGICDSVLSAIDNATFQVVSVISTTGLSSVDYFLPKLGYATVPVLLMMIVGGHTGSTAGGAKAGRIALAFKSLYYDVRENIVPRRIINSRSINKFGKQMTITKDDQSQNYTYLLIYIMIGFLGTFGLTLNGYGFRDSMIEFFSALGTVGMSIGIIGPDMNNCTMWIFIVGMIIARLEVYIIILALARIGTDIKDSISEMRNKKK